MKFNATERMISILLANEQIATTVNGEIRPVVARYGAQVPYIVVSTENSDVRRTKMGGVSGITSVVMFTIVAESYEQARDLADSICAIDGKGFEIQGYKEDYGDDKFVVIIDTNIDY